MFTAVPCTWNLELNKLWWICLSGCMSQTSCFYIQYIARFLVASQKTVSEDVVPSCVDTEYCIGNRRTYEHTFYDVSSSSAPHDSKGWICFMCSLRPAVHGHSEVRAIHFNHRFLLLSTRSWVASVFRSQVLLTFAMIALCNLYVRKTISVTAKPHHQLHSFSSTLNGAIIRSMMRNLEFISVFTPLTYL